MIQQIPRLEMIAEQLMAAQNDSASLEALGAACFDDGVPLPLLLAALPGTEQMPHRASVLASGYLSRRETRDGYEAAVVREQLGRRQAEITALQRVNGVATSSLDEATVLNNVVDAVADVMGVEVCSVYLLQGSNQLVLHATHGLNRSALGRARLSLGEGLTGWAAEQHKTVTVADLWCDARAKYLPETEEDPYHSMLCVPITSIGGEQTLGVLNVQTTERREFTKEEVTFLEMIAGQLGLSIQNARLHGQTDAQLQQKVNALTTLHQVVVAVASSLDLRRVLDTIAGQALGLCQGEGSLIFARKGHQQRLRVEAQCCQDEARHRELTENLALRAIQEGAPQQVELPGNPEEAPRALICLPLRGHGSTYGALAVYGRAGQVFDTETHDLLSDFASVAAIAIENAQLHESTQQNLETKSVLLSELHHRVKNNLQTVASLLSLALRHSRSEEASETLRESYNRVRSIAAAHDLLSRQAIGVTTIGEVARKVIDLLEPTLQGRVAVRFLTEGDTIEVETREATTLAILLNELVTNAVRHGLRGRESGTVRVLYGRQGSQVWVTVADDGNGLASDFSLAKNKGLGLSIVRTLVEADLHGQVDWASQQGARFTLLFTPPAPSVGRHEGNARK